MSIVLRKARDLALLYRPQIESFLELLRTLE